MGVPVSGDTTNAADDYHFSSGTDCLRTEVSESGPDVAYSFTAPSSGTYAFTVTPTTPFDIALYVVPWSCPDGPTLTSCLGGADVNFSGSAESVTVNLMGGQSYLVVVDSWTSSDVGTFTLSVDTAVNACTSAACLVYAHDATDLYDVDPYSMSVTRRCTVSNLNVSGSQETLFDLATSLDGTLWAVTPQNVYSINPDPNAGCPATYWMGLPTDAGTFNGLTTTLDGTLLGARANGEVAVIDPVGGTVTTVGSYGGNYGNSGDLVVLAGGQIMATAIDLTGSNTDDILVQLDPGNGYQAIRPVTLNGHSGLWGLASWSGWLYGFDMAGNIVQIDPSNGNVANTFPEGDGGLVWFGAASSPTLNP